MSGKTSRLSSLEARKKLLLVESNLNRALLAAEVAGIKREIHQLTHRAASLGLLAAGAAQAGMLAKGVASLFFHRGEAAERTGSSWWSILMKGVRMGGVVWSIVKSRK
jgi:hypothetical protein